MKFDPITKRTIGSIEVLLFVVAFELFRAIFFGATLFGVLVYGLALFALWLGRAHFKADFTLTQLYELFVSEKKDQEKPTP